METTEQPVLLAFGHFRTGEHIRLAVIAQDALLDLRTASDLDQFSTLLEREPVAILIEASAVESEAAHQLARAHPAGRRIPIIALAGELDDLAFAQTFSAGGDDAVELATVRPLLVRLRAARNAPRAPEPNPRGVAVVADSDESRRQGRARALHDAGFVVEFAATASEVLKRGGDPPSLVLLESDLSGASDAILEGARSRPQTVHVLLSPPHRVVADSHTFEGQPNAAAIDGYAPAESIVYLVNELQRPGFQNQRRTRRVLYGTTVQFRGEGRDRGDYGFTYNLSAGGLYVRTLAPPEEDDVWLELRPPRSNRWVHIEGKVVWRRRFGQAATATVPPGFGVQLLDATPRSMAAWLDGYIGLMDALQRPTNNEPREGDDPWSS